MRKLVAVIAVVCGLGLVAAPFALSLFDRAPAGERITDRFRQTMSERGLRDLAGNFQTMGALVSEFIDRTSPALAADLHMTSGQYDAYVARSFPAVAAGVRGIPPLVAFGRRRADRQPPDRRDGHPGRHDDGPAGGRPPAPDQDRV